MRAWQIVRNGAPEDALRLRDLPAPAAGPGEAVVDVAAAALGFPDYLLATGDYHDKPPLPFTIGGEAAGTVTATGDGVDLVAVGDRVVVAPGVTVAGRLAEQVSVPADLLLPIPDEMHWAEAAALFVAYHTSHIGLFRRGGLREGETLLVHGASGGIGSAAVQLGKAVGARVIAVAGGQAKSDICRQLGADIVVDHRVEDFVSVVKQLTGGRGADVIYDPVGGEVFDRSRRCVAVEGRIVVAGFASGVLPQLPVNHALIKGYSIVGFRTRPFRDDPVYRREVHDDLVAMYRRGAIRPLVEPMPFDDTVKALRRIGDRDVVGRIVVRVGS